MNVRVLILTCCLGLSVSPSFAQPVRVAASVPPLTWLAQQIGGERISVVNVVEPGQDPHMFEPTPRLMADLAESRLFLTCGMPYELIIKEKIKSQNPSILFVDTSQSVVLREEECSHAEEHDHHAMDPHIWLDPRNAVIMGANICAALKQADGEGGEYYSTRQADLTSKLSELHKRLFERLAPCRGTSFYIYHPAFGYFAEAYGLKQVSVEVEGKEPSARQLAALVDRAKKERVRVVFAQRQFSTRSAEMLAQAIGGKIVLLDDLAPNIIENLDAISFKFMEAIEGEKKRL